jgi:hypothetical protein
VDTNNTTVADLEEFTMKKIEVFKIAHETALPSIREKCPNGVYFKRSPEVQADFSRKHVEGGFAWAVWAAGR